MKKLILFLICMTIVCCAVAQTKNPTDYLKHLPKDIELDNSSIRSYQMVTDYYSYDFSGNFLNKKRVAGTVAYVAGGDIQWKNVYTSDSRTLDAEFSQGKNIEPMQNFRYTPAKMFLHLISSEKTYQRQIH